MNSLPLFIYSTVRSGEPVAIERAFGAATVLLILVLVLFVIARLLARQRTGGRSRRGRRRGRRPDPAPGLDLVVADPLVGDGAGHRPRPRPRDLSRQPGQGVPVNRPSPCPQRAAARRRAERGRPRRCPGGAARTADGTGDPERPRGVRPDRGHRLDLVGADRPAVDRRRGRQRHEGRLHRRWLVQGPQGLRAEQHRLRDLRDPLPGHRRAGQRRHQQRPRVRLPADRGGRHGLHLPAQDRRPAGPQPAAVRARRSPRSSPTRSPTGTTRRSPRTTTAGPSRRCRSPRWCAPTARARRRSSRTWMDKEYPTLWRPFYGKSGLTSYYPRKGRAIGQAGSDQVMNTIAGFAGNGTIGYVEYSYPVNKDYPVVKVLNKGGYYVEPTQYNVAVALTKAKINHGQELAALPDPDPRRGLPAPGPAGLPDLVLQLHDHPHRRDRPADDHRQAADAGRLHVLLAVRRADQGRPLRLLAAAAQPGAGRASSRSPSSRSPTRRSTSPTATCTQCNNPTFDGKNLSKNKLAEIAPQPAACDKAGRGTVRHRHRHQRAVDRRRGDARRHGRDARHADGHGGSGDRRSRGAGRRRRARWSTRTPVRSSRRRRPAPRRPAAAGRRLPGADRARLGPPGRHRRRSAGSPRSCWSRWCSCPACWSRRSGDAVRRAARDERPRALRRSRRPLAVSAVALLLAGLVAAFAPASATPVRRRTTAGRPTSPDARPRRSPPTKALTRVFENADGTTLRVPDQHGDRQRLGDREPARPPADHRSAGPAPSRAAAGPATPTARTGSSRSTRS